MTSDHVRPHPPFHRSSRIPGSGERTARRSWDDIGAAHGNGWRRRRTRSSCLTEIGLSPGIGPSRAGKEPQPTAVLVHGLAGCAEASYVVRLGRRLLHQGIRVVRINLRGAGAGFGLARGIYHAGRSDDLREVVALAATAHPGRGLAHRLDRLFARGQPGLEAWPPKPPNFPFEGLDCVLAANPPIDLADCAQQMRAAGEPAL